MRQRALKVVRAHTFVFVVSVVGQSPKQHFAAFEKGVGVFLAEVAKE
jgi:hypothetical protein